MISGVTVTVKVAHVRLCHSRMFFVRAYPRETQEMVFDAHDRAFAFFKGTCTRGIYDNMKTAVETVFIGKDRPFNRRFLRMCGHYLVEPTACTPASGWEKGQVENQVGLVRERFFTPRLKVASYEELNAWLLDRCIAYAKAHKHPELTDQPIWQVFEAERAQLVPIASQFDGFHATTAVGLQDLPGALRQQQILRRLARRWPAGRDPGLCRSHRDPSGWRGGRRACALLGPRRDDLRSLALRAGAGQQARRLSAMVRRSRIGCCRPSLERVRRKLHGSDDGDRQMVKVLVGGADRRPGRGRGRLRRGARRRRPFRRYHPQYSGAPARSRALGDDLDARSAAAAARADRRLRPLRQPAASLVMERTNVLELMSALKLYGMRAAYDEVMATASSAA